MFEIRVKTAKGDEITVSYPIEGGKDVSLTKIGSDNYKRRFLDMHNNTFEELRKTIEELKENNNE